jgi:Uma2 family endonuclease
VIPTEQEFAVGADDTWDHYEVVDGVRVELPPPSVRDSILASRLAYQIGCYGIEHGYGQVGSNVLFKLPLPPDWQRRPDVAFVPYSRWSKGRPYPDTDFWEVLPDLCVEVVSPTDKADELREKVEEYFRAGVRLVWVVYPRLQVVDVFEAADRVRVLRRADALDGGAVLPGFGLKLADLFPDPAAAS